MALNDAAADAVIDAWVDAMDPAPSDPAAVKAGFRGFARALYAGIVQHAEVLPSGTPAMEAGGDAVTGKGTVT